MSPTLLLRLTQLPKQVRYRFVRNNLFIVGRENGLIVDFMTEVLPPTNAKVKPSSSATEGENVGARVAAPARPNAVLPVVLPNRDDSVRLMLVGDTGTGSRQQYELAQPMLRYRQALPFEFALTSARYTLTYYGNSPAA